MRGKACAHAISQGHQRRKVPSRDVTRCEKTWHRRSHPAIDHHEAPLIPLNVQKCVFEITGTRRNQSGWHMFERGVVKQDCPTRNGLRMTLVVYGCHTESSVSVLASAGRSLPGYLQQAASNYAAWKPVFTPNFLSR